MMRTIGRSLFGIAWALLCATVVQAAADKATKKDPVQEVFTLPKTAKLDADQQAQFDRLKTEKEPELKAAWDQCQAAKDAAGKSAAMKKFNELKKETKSAIAKIQHPTSGAGTKKPVVTKPKREPVVKPKKEKPIKLPKDKPIRPGTLKPGLP